MSWTEENQDQNESFRFEKGGRVQISKKAVTLLNVLAERIHTGSIAEVLLHAVNLFDAATAAREEGYQLFMETPDGIFHLTLMPLFRSPGSDA